MVEEGQNCLHPSYLRMTPTWISKTISTRLQSTGGHLELVLRGIYSSHVALDVTPHVDPWLIMFNKWCIKKRNKAKLYYSSTPIAYILVGTPGAHSPTGSAARTLKHGAITMLNGWLKVSLAHSNPQFTVDIKPSS